MTGESHANNQYVLRYVAVGGDMEILLDALITDNLKSDDEDALCRIRGFLTEILD